MLTESKLKAARPMEKPYKLYDSAGLYALVQPTGAIWWRLRYRVKGSEKGLSLGVYPDVSLIKARERRDAAKEAIANGIESPQLPKAAAIQTASVPDKSRFMAVGEEWFEMKSASWKGKTVKKVRWLLNEYVYPAMLDLAAQKITFGDMPVDKITTPNAFDVVKSVEKLGKIETAHRVKDTIAHVLRYARAKGFKTINIADDMRGAIKVSTTRHHPAVTDPPRVGKLMTWIYGYHGSQITVAGLKLEAYLFPRPENLREMEWIELDLNEGTWIIPPEKMKGPLLKKNQGLIVPLPFQAVRILSELMPLTRHCRYVFPNERGCIYPMSNGALTAALNRGGWKDIHSWHGFRAMARTVIEEVLGYDPKYPEMQLAHEVKDPNGTAYNRTAFLQKRREMMQCYADYLDHIRNSYQGERGVTY